MDRNEWKAVGQSTPSELSEARITVHWACQVLGAAADALLPRAADDSHTNLDWDVEAGIFVGKDLGANAQLGLRPAGPTLLVLRDSHEVGSLDLATSRLEEALDWSRRELASATAKAIGAMVTRDYEMPPHPVSDGEPFGRVEAGVGEELGAWFANARWLLSTNAGTSAAAAAVWPHHFDMGGILFPSGAPPSSTAPQIGFGLSPGDSIHNEPYFYVSPWPIGADCKRGALPVGRWHQKDFDGMVLTRGELVDKPAQAATAHQFLDAALDEARRIIAE